MNRRLLPLILAALALSGCLRQVPEPKAEGRAIWFHRFEYCAPEFEHNQDSIRSYIKTTIDAAADANFNMVIFQVRGNGDAYYKSDIEPWGSLLTGTLGEDPGWDPLAYAIDCAHARGMELYAWMNTFPVWRGKKMPPTTTPLSPYLAHPDWLVCDREGQPMERSDHYVAFSPGVPAVHDYLIRLADDIASRYDIDGLHFDYIRYPDGTEAQGYSHDPISVKRFNSREGNPDELDWSDWQRQQMNNFVTKMYNTMKHRHPGLIVSAAVIGSHINGGWNGYGAVYQDAARWAETGKIDFVAPMLYWPLSHRLHPFLKRVREWEKLYTFDRYVFPGIGSYRYNTRRQDYNPTEIMNEIEALRWDKAAGMVFFDSRSVMPHYNEIRDRFYRHPAKLPPMPWKDIDSLKQAPVITEMSTRPNGTLTLHLEYSDEGVHRLCLYASDHDSSDVGNLVAIGNSDQGDWEIPDSGLQGKWLRISAVNAAWIESPLSPAYIADEAGRH